MNKVGIIGCGSITKFRHAPEYCEKPSAQTVDSFDPDRQRAKERADEFGGKVFNSMEVRKFSWPYYTPPKNVVLRIREDIHKLKQWMCLSEHPFGTVKRHQ